MTELVFVATTDEGIVDVFRLDSDFNWVTHFEKSIPPEWVLLENNICPDCVYAKSGLQYCKAALGLYSSVSSFSSISSIERISLTTITSAENIISRCTTAQEGLSILFFASLVFSGCSKFNKYK